MTDHIPAHAIAGNVASPLIVSTPPTHLLPFFTPRDGVSGTRLRHLAGKPFIYIGRDPDEPHLYMINVWCSDHERHHEALACHDEIFGQARKG